MADFKALRAKLARGIKKDQLPGAVVVTSDDGKLKSFVEDGRQQNSEKETP